MNLIIFKEEKMDKQAIKEYLEKNPTEHAEVLLDFLNNSSDLYSRRNEIGHITGSAFIVSDSLENALLILHAKYNKWVAPGGHVDEGEHSLKAATRESAEEVGIEDLELLKPEIFDIDIHRIPAATKHGVFEPEHWHFDVRYLFKVKPETKVDLNTLEAKGFKWPLLTEIAEDKDESISRQAKKAINFLKYGFKNEIKKRKI